MYKKDQTVFVHKWYTFIRYIISMIFYGLDDRFNLLQPHQTPSRTLHGPLSLPSFPVL